MLKVQSQKSTNIRNSIHNVIHQIIYAHPELSRNFFTFNSAKSNLLQNKLSLKKMKGSGYQNSTLTFFHTGNSYDHNVSGKGTPT